MFNKELEQDLIIYSQNQDAELFNTKLYEPLSNLFKWLCGRQARPLSEPDFKDIQQQAMVYVIKKMKYFKQGKGMTATSFVRMLMNQELAQRKQRVEKKIDSCVEFEPIHEPQTLALDYKTINDYQVRLEQYKQTALPEHHKVIDTLIASLTDKKMLALSYEQKIARICKKSKASSLTVKRTIKAIKQAKIYLDV